MTASRPARFGLGAWLALAFTLLSIMLTVVQTIVTERTASAQVCASIGINLAELVTRSARPRRRKT